jgi:predicted nucleic acid-binding protein
MSRSSAVCVDASLVVRLLLGQSQEIRSLWDRWDEESLVPVAPALIHYEASNALYQYEKQGELSTARVTEALEAALSLPIRLYADSVLYGLALQLARRFALPACYDAQYLALAEHLDVELWTCDSRLIKRLGSEFPRAHLAA